MSADVIRNGVKRIESGGSLSDKDTKDIIAAFKKYKHENIRLGELMPGVYATRGARRNSIYRPDAICSPNSIKPVGFIRLYQVCKNQTRSNVIFTDLLQVV